MATQWYCKIAGYERGPLSAQALKSMADKGRLQPDTLVRQGPEGSWVPASRVKGLFSKGGAPATQQAKPKSDAKSDSDSSAVLVAKPLEDLPRAGETKPPPKAKPVPPRVAKPLAEPPALPDEKAGEPAAAVSPTTAASPKAESSGAAAPNQFGVVATERNSGDKAAGRTDAADPSGKQKKRNLLLVGGLLLAIVVLGGIALVVAMSRKQASEVAKTSGEPAGQSKALDEEDIGNIDEPNADRADGKWSDASKSPIKRGDVQVKVISAEVGRPKMVRSSGRAARPKSEALVILLELCNTNATKKLAYTSWSDRNLGVTLKDNFGNPYTQKTKKVFRGALVEGQSSSGSIYPGKSIVDVVIFEPPIDKAKFLRLELPATAFGGSGMLSFQIPITMVGELSEEDTDISSKKPVGAQTGRLSKALDRANTGEEPLPPGRGVPAIEQGIKDLESKKKPADKSDKPAADEETDPFAEGAENDKDDDPDGDVSKIMKDIDEVGGGDKK